MALQLINITKFYKYGKNKQMVIDDLTIKFPSVGMVGIVGKSGCGKSTLLNIIAGIEKPNQGKVLIDDHPVDYRYINEYRRTYISYVYQFYNLINALTVKQNLTLLAHIKGKPIKELETKLLQYSNALNIEHVLDHYPSELSGGQKQRVGLIRAFLCDTPILLADEPTGALNESLGNIVMKQLNQYAKNHLVIVISHDHSLIKRYTKNIINLDTEDNYYDFNQSRYHKYRIEIVSKQSLRLFFYVKQQLLSQKKKIMMMFVSQIFIILAFVLLLSACNGGWLYIEKKFAGDPLKEIIEVSKNDYLNATFSKDDVSKLKDSKLIKDVEYKTDFSFGDFKSDQELELNTYQIKEQSYIEYISGNYPKEENEILISQMTADKYKFILGAIIKFKVEDKEYALKISGIINDQINEGANFYCDSSLLADDLIEQIQNKNALVLYSNKVDEVIDKYQKDYLLINYHQEYLDNYQDIFMMAYLVVIAFVLISFIISLILISIILKTIYIERKRDTSLLLANGLNKSKAVSLFCNEAVLMGALIGAVGSIMAMGLLKVLDITNLSKQLFNIENLFVLPKYYLSNYDLYMFLIFIYMCSCWLAGMQASFKISKMDISILLKED